MTVAALLAAAFDEMDPPSSAGPQAGREVKGHNPDITELIAQIHAGSVRAAEQLFRTQYSPLVRYARRFTDSVDAAEDLAQNALVQMIEQIQQGHHRQLHSVTALLRTMTRRRAANQWKREQRMVRMHEVTGEDFVFSRAEINETEIQPDAHLERAELLVAIRHAFNALPPRARLIATMHWYDHLGRQEIATELGISVRTVDAQLYLAAGRIREALASYR